MNGIIYNLLSNLNLIPKYELSIRHIPPLIIYNSFIVIKNICMLYTLWPQEFKVLLISRQVTLRITRAHTTVSDAL